MFSESKGYNGLQFWAFASITNSYYFEPGYGLSLAKVRDKSLTLVNDLSFLLNFIYSINWSLVYFTI